MNFNELSKEIHDNAVAHGWWDEPCSFGDIVALCHSELSEALEEYRARRPMVWRKCQNDDPFGGCDYLKGAKMDGNTLNTPVCTKIVADADCTRYDDKPEGIAVELADCIIRILDYCGKEGIDIEEIIRIKHEYNKTRPYRHGRKAL